MAKCSEDSKNYLSKSIGSQILTRDDCIQSSTSTSYSILRLDEIVLLSPTHFLLLSYFKMIQIVPVSTSISNK